MRSEKTHPLLGSVYGQVGGQTDNLFNWCGHQDVLQRGPNCFSRRGKSNDMCRLQVFGLIDSS